MTVLPRPVETRPPLILASRSPRRASLLAEAGFVFKQRDPPYADPPQPEADHPDALALAAELADAKARSLVEAGGVPGTTLVLGADTVCLAEDGRLVGTPTTPEATLAMLRGFVGRSHRVVSGVALLRGGVTLERFADVATVTWGAVDSATLEAYTVGGAWRGKAGGYNLYDRQAAGWPITVTGDPTTVVGLPMQRLAPLLVEHMAPSAVSDRCPPLP